MRCLANLGQFLGEAVRQRNRRRHQLWRLVRGEAEHHALVAGAESVHALRNIGALAVDRRDHSAGVAVKAFESIVIADLANRLADQRLKVHIGLGCNLAGNDDESGAGQRLARDTAQRVLRKAGIENHVGDLISNLVRMTFGHGL